MEIRIEDHIPNFLLCDYKKSTKGLVRFQNHLKIAEECLNILFSESAVKTFEGKKVKGSGDSDLFRRKLATPGFN